MNAPVLPKHFNDIEAEELIWGPPEVILRGSDMRRYQRWMSDRIVELPGVFLGADMGLGKTGAVLHAIQRLLRAGTVKHVLIVAPLYVAEETWTEEIAKWAFARHLTYRVCTGTKEERVAALKLGPADILIVNRENLLWLLKTLGLKRWIFDMIVYDEASRLKKGVTRTNPKHVRQDGTVADPKLTELGVIDAVRFKTKKIVELSGTPAPNGLIDLYGPIFAIDRGERLGASMSAFKARWFQSNQYTRKVTPHPHSQGEIMSLISDVFFSLKSEDYLELPPLIEVPHKVKLPEKVMQQYRELEREASLEIEKNKSQLTPEQIARYREMYGDADLNWSDPTIIEAVNSGVLVGKLLQFANGSLYDEDGNDHLVHTKKLDVLESILEESGGKPLLVAYSFQFDKDAILKRFPFAKVFGENRNDKRHWNAGRYPMMLMHPASAGHGLNFQAGSNIAVWYGLNWSLELYLQFIKRLWRSGQKEDRVLLHKILAEGTADYDVDRTLVMKGVEQDSITDAVRVRLAA